MTERSILYIYDEYDIEEGFWRNSSSIYSIWEDGVWILDEVHCPLMENEADIREYLSAYEPFTIHEDTNYWD